ncbi:MAG: RdgB/HAM1 family non-canonical purine NTP pyrophosphatase [Clostridiales bacterium]|jgi:XTP/dITP diphosphohydrolase|nr:RdgB/HAM1 family non-canonical purine NTP pyrophosphatase [Clostridiales bacterium]
MRLAAATKNEGKTRELRAMFADCADGNGNAYELLSMGDLGIDADVVEDADTFEGNALKKAEAVMRLCGEITIADDSGLCVEALGGAPGVYSARYSGAGATDSRNNEMLLKHMEHQTNRNAKFVCVIAVVFPDGGSATVRGELRGQIAYGVSGTGGFGYDALFYLPQYGKTAAEIPQDLKNRISHRGQAVAALKEYLARLGMV